MQRQLVLLALTLALVAVDTSGCKSTAVTGNVTSGAVDTAGSDQSAEQSVPTEAFEHKVGKLTVTCKSSGDDTSKYKLQFSEGDKVVLSEEFISHELPQVVFVSDKESDEYLPIKMSPVGTEVIMVRLTGDNGTQCRVYQMSGLPDGKQVKLLEKIESDAFFEAVSNGYDIAVEEVQRFSGARRVQFDVYLRLQEGKLELDFDKMRAVELDVDDLVADAKIALNQNDEIQNLIAQKGRGKRGRHGRHGGATRGGGSGADGDAASDGDGAAASDADGSGEISAQDALYQQPLQFVSPELGDDILKCIYAGRVDLGREVFNRAWPPRLKGKKEYWNALMLELARSPYWPQIEYLNKGRGKFAP